MAQSSNEKTRTWTYTYLKAVEGQQEELAQFLKKNWLAMDSIAVEQKLFASYELIQNVGDQPTDWDYLVAVEYFTANTYDEVSDRFEAIRKKHVTVLINGKGLRDLGRIVKSELVRKL